MALLSGSFETRLQKAATLGYTGIELVICDPAALDAKRISEQLDHYGLKAAAVATGFISGYRNLTLVNPDPEVRRQAAQLLLDLIRFADALGAPVVTIGSFRGLAAPVGGVEPAKKMLHEALQEADSLAAALGVKLALEPIRIPETDFFNYGSEVCAFIREGGYRAVGLLLDIYHVCTELADPMGVFCDHSDALVHVHLADTDRKPLGKGNFDFVKLEAVLQQIGYTGWQSVELPRGDDPDENGRLFDRKNGDNPEKTKS